MADQKKRVEIVMTQEQFEEIKAAASSNGVSHVATFMRSTVLRKIREESK